MNKFELWKDLNSCTNDTKISFAYDVKGVLVRVTCKRKDITYNNVCITILVDGERIDILYINLLGYDY